YAFSWTRPRCRWLLKNATVALLTPRLGRVHPITMNSVKFSPGAIAEAFSLCQPSNSITIKFSSGVLSAINPFITILEDE
ncbi:hypothetical protein, partial [Pseudomonas sp. ICMP 561]|uniref:hypothetical protein n=1 Tax=Pseudomonas sp. ICMP 561 TaxID=1718918 RepID=UPI001C54C148